MAIQSVGSNTVRRNRTGAQGSAVAISSPSYAHCSMNARSAGNLSLLSKRQQDAVSACRPGSAQITGIFVFRMQVRISNTQPRNLPCVSTTCTQGDFTIELHSREQLYWYV